VASRAQAKRPIPGLPSPGSSIEGEPRSNQAENRDGLTCGRSWSASCVFLEGEHPASRSALLSFPLLASPLLASPLDAAPGRAKVQREGIRRFSDLRWRALRLRGALPHPLISDLDEDPRWSPSMTPCVGVKAVLLRALGAHALAPARYHASGGAAARGSTRKWHHPFTSRAKGSGGSVSSRVTNASGRRLEGFPATLRIGRREGEIDLVGARAEELRAADAAGWSSSSRSAIESARRSVAGAIDEGSDLTVPVSARCLSYAGPLRLLRQSSAWPSPISSRSAPTS